MKLSKAKIMREAERFLKRTGEYQEDRDVGKSGNYRIQYILSKGDGTQPENVVAYAYSEYREQEILFCPFRKGETVCYNWSSDFGHDLFEPLENGDEIVGMTLDCHSAVWTMIEDFHDRDGEYRKGMQMYLAYCKRNGITKQLLQEKVSHEGMDVMTLYKRDDLAKETKKSQKEQER